MLRTSVSAMLLAALASFTSACGLVRSAQISKMDPVEIQSVSNQQLCSPYNGGPVVAAERQRRGLGDCSPASQHCVEMGYPPGTSLYLQCQALKAQQDEAERQAWLGVAQVGAQMMAAPPPAPQLPAADDHVCIAPNNTLYRC
jgi:hypothetical protein